MIKAIIFDCFGVLVGMGFDNTYRRAGGDPSQDKAFIDGVLDKANRGQLTNAEFKRQIIKQLNISEEAYEQAVKSAEQPNFELLSYIKELRKNYKTAILSNVNGGVLQQKIDATLLQDCFDEIVVSAEVGFIKPEHEIYQLTAKRLGVIPNECVFIDDKPIYVQAAQAVGMRAIVYQDFDQMKRGLELALA